MTDNKTGFQFLDEKVTAFENQLSLPFWSDDKRAMPNHIGRSALFTPVKRGPREFFENETIWSRKDVTISYTGVRLDEADADLWMQLIHLYRDSPSNQRIFFSRANLLFALGKTRAGASYQWLEEAMTRLQGVVKLRSKKYIISSPLIQKFGIDKVNDQYFIEIDPQIAQLFGNQEFSLFHWKRRLKLKYALAKSLQRHIAASSQTVQRFYYTDLLNRFKRSNANIKYLKRDLSRACQELVDVKILLKFTLEDSFLRIVKNKNIP